MAKRISPSTVIDLTLDSDLDSDEEQESRLGDVTRRLYSKNNKGGPKTKRARTVQATNSDEEVEVVEAPIASPVAAPNFNVAENVDEELQVVGTRNGLKLPHLRHHCEVHPFTVKAANRDQLRIQNERYCELCYCYVCDAPVKDCKSWSNVGGVWQNSHCNATDKQNWWVKEREAAKSGNGGGASKRASSQNRPALITRLNSNRPPTATGNRTANSSVARGSSNRSNSTGSSRTVAGSSHPSNSTGTSRTATEQTRAREISDRPTATTNMKARASAASSHRSISTGSSSNTCHKNDPGRCMDCGWQCNLDGLEKTKWRCLKCGRLTLPRKQDQQNQPHQSRTHYDFGERSIGFRIVAGGVDRTRPNNTDPGLEKSVFDSRLGKSPGLKAIMSLVAEWDEEKVRENNADAIILDNQNDIALLRLLSNVGFRSTVTCDFNPGWCSTTVYFGNIAATWNAQTATGTFKIRLSVPWQYTKTSDQSDVHARLLGCWFKIFPLKLGTISGTLKASKPAFKKFQFPPTKAAKKAFKAAVSSHNEKADELLSSLTLTSGCSNRDIGGYTSNDISLQATLERFYREHFPHRDFASRMIKKCDDWDKISNHHENFTSRDHDYVLSHSDRQFAATCLRKSVKSASGDTTQDLLAHLENLGHEPELTCEGLSVELLEFQKQSLRWAMERETTPGGIQSYLWVKVPIENFSLYFNPILGRFREDKPKTVRGGIIAEEMGLGKTIISLALILKHPAPSLPISGSDISCLANAPVIAAGGSQSNILQWDAGLYSQTSVDNKLRGSVLSRGTLVICPVSLVGQWIEEAKSKLSNPGLLYPYHGGNRIRDAKKLAENAIVVTTYQVLASDDTYHRRKSSNPDKYCPPLEQVRWWRIICDEGHSLRQGSTQRNRSLSQLVADNKWIVTGTPVSTSMLDLRNQLKLIGIEDADRMLQRERMYDRRNVPESPGNLRFLLRNIMIRHTQKQVYRGTNTTLMSLPPKNERSIEITLSDTERKEYDTLDKTARDFYVQFKASHSKELSKNYLLLSQKLTPQRVACAGGQPPLNPEAGNGEEDDDNDGETKSRKKKEVKLSDFCFASKLMALIEELKQARDSDPTSKSLVFSHFNMTLDWLKKELPNHGFQFRTLSGSMSMKQRAKALHDFQADPPTTIFLLSMRAGNCGINLTQANRVFLMEPGFNPALEKQSIGRVHRLGQKRKVEIIRLFVKDSIETRICKFLETKYGVDNHRSKEESKKEQKQSDSGKDQNEVFEVVGNLASERPKNAMVTSEFDLLFGVESKSEAMEPSMQDVAMPDAAISSGFL